MEKWLLLEEYARCIRKENHYWKAKEKKQAQAKIKLQLIEEESNRKFKKLYWKCAWWNFFVADEKRNFVEVNRAVSSIFGYSATL
jgi:hypothetical protein